MIDPDFWRGKRVFLTGHTGFKGAWLSLWLRELGAELSGYSLAPQTEPNLYTIAGVRDGLADETIADIRDGAALAAAVRRADPEIALHLAAQALVLPSYDDPVETFSTNVVGTVSVLNALRAAPSLRAAIAVTSDKCYENREWPWGYRETDPMGGHDPYSASKGAAELAIAAMRRCYFPPEGPAALASARAGNVIGGGDWSIHRLVPDLLRALAAGKPCAIRHPQAIRPWQHVLDPLAGYLVLAEALWRDGPAHAMGWNFGPREENAKPVAWIAERLAALWGGPADWVPTAPPAHENAYLKLDIGQTTSRLPWRPVWSIDEALASIASWHRAHADGADMRALTLAQIGDFSRAATTFTKA